MGLILGTAIGILKVILPQYADTISRITKISCISVICFIFLFSFFYIGILTFKQLKFSQFVIEELRNIGFSEKLHNELIKELKKNSKKKDSTMYMTALNYLAIEANSHYDYQKVLELYSEVDVEKLSKALRIDSGKAPQNNVILFTNMCDLLFNSYYRLNMVSEADNLYKYFEKTYQYYISKYAVLDPVLLEAKFMYLLTKGNFSEAREVLYSIKEKDALECLLSFKTNSLELDLIEGKLTIEEVNNTFDECKSLIDEKSPVKAFHHQCMDNGRDLYLSKLNEVK